MSTFLIVNADDFGRTPEINSGIVQAFQNGIVTSTSLMVNFPAFENAAKLAKQYDLPAGIHFNLTEGKPVRRAADVPSLVNANGLFFSKNRFFARLFTGRIKRHDLERELAAQLQKCRDNGVQPDHYDSHHHIHATGVIDKICRELAALPARWVSWPAKTSEVWKTSEVCAWLTGKIRQATVRLFAGKNRRPANLPQYFWGFELTQARDKHTALRRILANLSPGVHELMCHPGHISRENIGNYNEQRAVELAAFCDATIKEQLLDMGIKLLSYRDVGRVESGQ